MLRDTATNFKKLKFENAGKYIQLKLIRFEWGYIVRMKGTFFIEKTTLYSLFNYYFTTELKKFRVNNLYIKHIIFK